MKSFELQSVHIKGAHRNLYRDHHGHLNYPILASGSFSHWTS